MNKIKLACSLASLALATQAFALTQVVDSGVISGSFVTGAGGLLPAAVTPPTGGTAPGVAINLSVPAFSDAPFGYLLSVSYELQIFSYGDFKLQNFLPQNSTHSVQWSQDGSSFSGGGLASPAAIFTSAVGPSFPGLAPGAQREGRSQSYQQNETGSGGSLAAYNLPGPVNFVFTPNLSFTTTASIDPVQPSTFNQPPVVNIGARLIVTYTYSDIPEPSTYAAGAFLLAGAGFIARRRMMAK
jgi:hypothetical protein